MSEHKLDVLIFPQSFGPGPEVGQAHHFEETTVSEINIGGFPAVTIPCGYYRNGFPFSLILLGRLWDDAGVLAFAHAFLSRAERPRQNAGASD
jgi:aspartyl-tRNA(Asn)/glutamyl-tRNA(Gln) amidotransferase subunit A